MPKTKSSAFTVTTKANVAVKVLNENPRRRVFDILNLDDTEIFLGYDQSVSATGRPKGKRIAPSYGSYEDEYAKDEIWIICTAADKEVTVSEVTEVG